MVLHSLWDQLWIKEKSTAFQTLVEMYLKRLDQVSTKYSTILLKNEPLTAALSWTKRNGSKQFMILTNTWRMSLILITTIFRRRKSLLAPLETNQNKNNSTRSSRKWNNTKMKKRNYLSPSTLAAEFHRNQWPQIKRMLGTVFSAATSEIINSKQAWLREGSSKRISWGPNHPTSRVAL